MGAVRKPRQRGGRSRILGVHSRIGDCLKQDFDRDLWDLWEWGTCDESHYYEQEGATAGDASHKIKSLN